RGPPWPASASPATSPAPCDFSPRKARSSPARCSTWTAAAAWCPEGGRPPRSARRLARAAEQLPDQFPPRPWRQHLVELRVDPGGLAHGMVFEHVAQAAEYAEPAHQVATGLGRAAERDQGRPDLVETASDDGVIAGQAAELGVGVAVQHSKALVHFAVLEFHVWKQTPLERIETN